MRFVFNFTHNFLLTPDHTIVSKLIAEIRKSESNSHELWGFFSREAVYSVFHNSQFLEELLDTADYTPIIHKDHLISHLPGSMNNLAELLMGKGKGQILERDNFTSLFSKQLIVANTCILQF
ncbi:MAG: hypothetical protein E4G98_01250 [Promethearchaeota archaeon]|nr:MAG: hypothetical protein E4G98_01250 [Candidatus Lokiarchaeota archaeon]